MNRIKDTKRMYREIQLSKQKTLGTGVPGEGDSGQPGQPGGSTGPSGSSGGNSNAGPNAGSNAGQKGTPQRKPLSKPGHPQNAPTGSVPQQNTVHHLQHGPARATQPPRAPPQSHAQTVTQPRPLPPIEVAKPQSLSRRLPEQPEQPEQPDQTEYAQNEPEPADGAESADGAEEMDEAESAVDERYLRTVLVDHTNQPDSEDPLAEYPFLSMMQDPEIDPLSNE